MARRASEPVRAVLLAAALVAAYLAFHELVTLLVTLVITLIISLPLAAAAGWCERRGIPRAVGALVALLLGLAAFGALLALVIPAFIDQGQQFIDQIPHTFDDIQNRISDATHTDRSEVGDKIQDYLQGYADKPSKLIGPATQIGLGVAGALASIVVVLLTAFYIALRPQPLVDGMLSLFPERRRPDAQQVLTEIRAAWIGWLRGVGIDMLISGGLLYVGLLIVGLDFALVFAVVSALFVVIPYFGAVAGGLPPVLFALSDSPTKALIVLGIYVLVQQIEGNLIIPIVMSRQVSLHPAVIIIGVVVVGNTIGFIGLFVAVPLISAFLILVRAIWVEPMAREDERRSSPADTAGGQASSVSTTSRPTPTTIGASS